jgi:hypothetical protein
MHQTGADRKCGKGAAEHQPGRLQAGSSGCRRRFVHPRNLREIAPRVTASHLYPRDFYGKVA